MSDLILDARKIGKEESIQMSFEELEREVRQDLMAERWRKYRPGVIALVVSVLAAVAGYKGCLLYTSPSPRDRG